MRPYRKEFGEDSVPIIDEYIKNTNEAIQRAGKGKDPIKKAREIRQLKEKLNFLSGVKNAVIPRTNTRTISGTSPTNNNSNRHRSLQGKTCPQ